jgi:hypothetical protein
VLESIRSPHSALKLDCLGSGISNRDASILAHIFLCICLPCRFTSDEGLKNLLDKFHDFGYVKLRELEHGVAEAAQSSGHHRKIKAEDCVVAAEVA